MATFELLKVEDGVEHRRYENGDIRDQNGRLLVRPQRIVDAAITPETARDMVRRKKELYLEAFERGVTRASGAMTVYDAMAAILEKRAKVAIEDAGRAGNEAAKLVLQALDAYQEKKIEHEHVERQEYSIEPETLEILEKLLEAKRGL